MDNAVTGLTDAAVGPELAKAPTGIAGLDEITGGGLPRNRVTLPLIGDHRQPDPDG